MLVFGEGKRNSEVSPKGNSEYYDSSLDSSKLYNKDFNEKELVDFCEHITKGTGCISYGYNEDSYNTYRPVIRLFYKSELEMIKLLYRMACLSQECGNLVTLFNCTNRSFSGQIRLEATRGFSKLDAEKFYDSCMKVGESPFHVYGYIDGFEIELVPHIGGYPTKEELAKRNISLEDVINEYGYPFYWDILINENLGGQLAMGMIESHSLKAFLEKAQRVCEDEDSCSVFVNCKTPYGYSGDMQVVLNGSKCKIVAERLIKEYPSMCKSLGLDFVSGEKRGGWSTMVSSIVLESNLV